MLRRALGFALVLSALSGLVCGLGACGSDVVQEPTGTGSGGGGSSAESTTEASSTATGGTAVGGACDIEGSMRCSDADPGAFLQCVGGEYVELGDCDAGVACQNVQGADSVACGSVFLGVDGTPCVGEATSACDLAREVVLGCEGGTWTVFTHCAPVSCGDVPLTAGQLCNGIACENCGYTIGDRCRFPAGSVNCSTSGAAIVGCEAGIVTLYEDCGASGLTCTRNGGVIECL